MTQDETGGSVVDHNAPPQTAPGVDPAKAFRSAPPKARLTARFQPALNAALWQNHVPVLSELAVANAGEQPLGDIEIELDSRPAVLRPRTWRAAGLMPGQIRTFDDLDIPLDGPFLSGLSEATRGTVSLVARSGGEIVGEFTQDIRILAFNEWGGTAGIPDILAAFVQPNDPAVARIIHAASDLLRASGKVDSFEGYQGSSKTRVWEQTQAIWNAVCGMDLRYINPPPSFVAGGQRIRTARQIAEERLATCLDLAVLFCSCLEAAGLRPLIVLQRVHAFAGVWLSKGDFGTSTVDDAPGLRTRLKLDDLKLFETTSTTQARKPSFQQATLAGGAHVEPENDADFEGLIDIHRARQRRILPLASAATGYAFQAGAADAAELALPAIEDAPPLRDDMPTAEDPPPATAEDRLARWRKRLLDLTGRNRLLNLPASGRQVLWVDCPDPAKLEDRLAEMRGRSRNAPLKFRPWPDLMGDADPRSATLHRKRLQEDANLAFAREAMAKGELVVGRDEASLQASLTEIYRKARADQQEGGSNTLFLTIGTLLWRREDRETPYRAPLILVPVVLERPSVRSGFVLRVHDDETRLNSTLLEMLRQEFALQFPTLETERPPEDEAGFDVPAIMDTFRSKLRDVRGWEVRDEVALTTLSFTKFLMWKDLADRAEALRGNVVSRRLMDGPVAEVTIVSGGGGDRNPPAGALDDDLAAANLYCPLEGDSSQLRAVARAAAGESFVLIGPPGTGKSQTIANIVTNTLAQGRTVLFVAEKQAALEVVQRRLKSVGVADFCLDLFSSKVSKTAVLGQLERAQSASEADDGRDWAAAKADLATLRDELNGYVRELHRPGRNGWTPFRAIGAVLRAADGGVPELALAWSHSDVHDAGDWRRLVEAVEEAREVLRRAGDAVRGPALAGIEQAEWSPVWQTRLLEAARQAATRLDEVEQATVVVCRTLKLGDYTRSRPGLQRLGALAGLLRDPIGLEAAWALSEGAVDVHEAVQVVAAQASRHRDVCQALTGSWQPGVYGLPLAALRSEWRAAGEKWALPRTMAQRTVRKRLALEASGPVPEDCGPDLDRLLELQAIAASVAATPHTAVLGRSWRGIDTDFMRIQAAYEWGRRIRSGTAACTENAAELASLRALIRQLVGEAADLLAPSGSVGTALARLSDAWAAAEEAFEAVATLAGSPVARLVPEDRPDWLAAVSQHLTGWSAAARSIQEWCAWRGVSQSAEAQGLGPLIRAMEDGIVGPSDAVRALEANYARWWIDLAVDAAPRLRGFVAARHETRIERFRILDARMLELSSRVARARITGAIPNAVQRHADPEYAVLTRELAKRQRHLPVRQLASRMPKALRRLTPCLMMSPLSVAQYLPADAEPFDLVIFDEASQITTWDAIGAVGRGRQVIVVGDPRQLPPTSFFERRSGEEDGAAVEVETHDLDSILDDCLGAGIPSVELTWHYRSRHESLIAFSNQVYYGGRLVTFPSPVTRDDAVSFRYLADGIYARGGARTNEREARAVVAEALAILRTPEARSLGIVTFNAEQQGLIEDLLDKARRDDPALERHFADDAAEPVLVKNLEGIQGEERDVMLFSLTYGPDTTGRIALNFGPLNLAGGERRLNVAVTRARERLVVFGSVRAEQLDLSRTGAVGVRHLKQFLSFAEHGVRSFATMTQGSLGDHESLFEAEVAERLRRLGWTAHPQVGVSGFRVDLGIVDPDAAGSYLAGVECDGATYHRGATARDRDRLRQHVLENLGWRILRVWSTDWWTNAAREAERLHGQLGDALAKARVERAERPPAPPDMGDLPVEGTEMLDDGGTVLPPQEADPMPHDEAGPAPEPELFYDAAYRDRLSVLVAELLRKQGPLREDRLVQAVARLHGFGRAGREIRDRVMAILPGTSTITTEDIGRFVWPPGIDPASWNMFRAPAAGRVADPAEMPLPELVALARRCMRPDMADEAILTAMRDACGLQRLRETARNRCVAALAAARG
jgi:very-short-patch-repair endonuclease